MPRAKKQAVEKTAALSRREKLMALKEQINKDFKGKGVMMAGDEYEAPFMVMRRPSGLIELDIATGGGLPAGGVTEIIGSTSAGKTTLMNQYFKMQQDLRGNDAALAVAMTEGKFDKGHAKFNCGVRLPLAKAECAAFEKTWGRPLTEEEKAKMREEVGFFEELAAGTVETLYEMILDVVQDGLYDVVGIDSWGSFLTQAMADGSMGDRHYAGAAGPNTLFANKINPLFALPVEGEMNYTTLIGINQYREKMNANAMAGEMGRMNVQGGNALKHLKLVSIFLSGKGKWEEVKGRKRLVGKTITWQIYKGKAGCHDGPKGEFDIIHGLGIDTASANLLAAARRGIVEKKGSWLTLRDPKTGDEWAKTQGTSKMADLLRQDPDMEAAMNEATLRFAVEEEGAQLVTNYLPLENDG